MQKAGNKVKIFCNFLKVKALPVMPVLPAYLESRLYIAEFRQAKWQAKWQAKKYLQTNLIFFPVFIKTLFFSVFYFFTVKKTILSSHNAYCATLDLRLSPKC